jgi:hypothetical protein
MDVSDRPVRQKEINMRDQPVGLYSSLVLSVALAGCYVMPVSPDGQPAYPYPYAYPYPAGAAAPLAATSGPAPAMLQARLYPANEVASQTGMLSGTVTNLMNGRGRFQLQYKAETLNGEATRIDNDQRRGVASAYGASGAFMSCEYQMQSPRQGAGSCTFSNGAKYPVHLGM